MRDLLIIWLIGLLLFPGCMSVGPESEVFVPAQPVRTDSRPGGLPTFKPPETKPAEKDKDKGKIQPGDTIIVTVWQHPELSRERAVSPEGFLQLPLFGELKVSGLTTPELEKMLTEEMTPYLKNPLVWVERKAPALTQKITVLGAVSKPANYEFPKMEEVKLLPLLGTAGGYTESADLEQVYIFRTASSGQRQTIGVNLTKLLSDPLTSDITLQNNDVLFLKRTSGSEWNATLAKISPTLQFIAIVIGIVWAGQNLRERERDK